MTSIPRRSAIGWPELKSLRAKWPGVTRGVCRSSATRTTIRANLVTLARFAMALVLSLSDWQSARSAPDDPEVIPQPADAGQNIAEFNDNNFDQWVFQVSGGGDRRANRTHFGAEIGPTWLVI